MNLDELFQDSINEFLSSFNLEENSRVSDTENYIIDRIVAIKSSGINQIYLSQLERELEAKAKTPTSGVMALDKEFLMDFLESLEAVDSIEPSGDTESGEADFVINFARSDVGRRISRDQEEKEEDKISKAAIKTIDKKKKEKEKTASKGGELTL